MCLHRVISSEGYEEYGILYCFGTAKQKYISQKGVRSLERNTAHVQNSVHTGLELRNRLTIHLYTGALDGDKQLHLAIKEMNQDIHLQL